jgi:predicted Fe-S protein YdhL (DUF1289 family)
MISSLTDPKLDPPPVVASPCVSVCAIDPARGWCIGCYRTLDEIAAWIDLDSAGRLAVWKAIEERRRADDANR